MGSNLIMLVWTRTDLRFLALVVFVSWRQDAPSIELFPQHFHLRPGERIHYTPTDLPSKLERICAANQL